MARSLDILLKEADYLIESKLQAKTASAPAAEDKDIFQLADALRGTTQKTAQALEPETDILTLTEKIAHAVAIVETLQNLDTLSKLASFEDKALASGFKEEEVGAFLEKQAEKMPYKSVLKGMGWLGGAGAIGAAAGSAKGYGKGKEKGYEQALSDVNQALSGYNG